MNNEIIAINCPDIHGRTFWKNVADKYDGSIPFVFLGDYLDPYPDENITFEMCKKNFFEIWEFKKKWGDNVILLLGNHDLSYYDEFFRCCRFSYQNYEWYHDFLVSNFEDFKIAYEINNKDKTILFSHAGVHPHWLNDNKFDKKYTAEYINSLFINNPKSFYDYSYNRGGYLNYGSPVWTDIRDFLYINEYDNNIIQVVGHTQLATDMIKINNIYCIDSRQPFILTNNNQIKKYNDI